MHAEFLPGNRIELLNSGADYFPALLRDLDAAECEIFLESYIYANDRIGHAVSAALCRAAARGVRVRLTVDGFGARDFDTDFLPLLKAAGVETMRYRPEIGTFRLRRHRLRRLHRKLAVIDGRIASVGGINIVDDYNARPAMCPRYDYAVRVEGPVVAQVHAAALRMWEIVTWASLKRRFRPATVNRLFCPISGEQRAAFLIRDNIRHRHDILNAYLAAIQAARSDILIANAYFLPGLRFARALLAAVRRGVRVRILLQGKTDHPLLRYATQALYEAALDAGIEIYEYEKSFMHAKVAVIDGHWATVGSSNIDPFSLLIAKEANIVVRDAAFGAQLRDRLISAISHGGRELLAEQTVWQPWYSRLLRWLAYGLVRASVGIAGYGQRHCPNQEGKPK